MTSVSPPAPLAGPVFVRLLARVAGAGARAGDGPPLAATLAQWIDWPRAVTLSGALDERLDAPADGPRFDAAEDAACLQLRAQLREAIANDPQLAIVGADAARAGDVADFAPLRSCYLAHQRAMLTATGRLRGRLRDMLAARAPLARVGEVDAAMEQVLAPREHALLAAVPDLLAAHFERMREAAPAPPASAPGPAPHAWLDRFRLDMRELLLAEFDLRFSPVDALLAALRTPDPSP